MKAKFWGVTPLDQDDAMITVTLKAADALAMVEEMTEYLETNDEISFTVELKDFYKDRDEPFDN